MKKAKGRPQIIDSTKLQLLRAAFRLGCSDEEACLQAEISPSTLYNYQQKNDDFLEEKRALKMQPLLKARKTVVDSLDDPDMARWYLERKAKDEFSLKALLSADINSTFSLTDILKAADEDRDKK